MAIDSPRPATAHPALGALRAALVLRAVPLIVVGLVITFTKEYPTSFGFVMLGVLGLASAAGLVLGALRLPAGDALRGLHLGLAVVATVVGGLALALSSFGLAFLLLLVGAYAAFGGVGELVWGIRRRGAHPIARDAIVVGAATALLALIATLVGDPRSAAGFLGAYAIIAGVFLVIAGISVGGTADGTTDSTPGTTADKEHSPS